MKIVEAIHIEKNASARDLSLTGDKQYIANPEGAKAGERYQDFDVEGFPSESTKAPM